jgi:hypothetical protein
VTISFLTLHQGNDVDYFLFYSNHVGSGSDFVRVDFTSSLGNVGLELLDDQGNVIESSTTDADFERISLDGVPEGWYFVRVFGEGGDTSTEYELSINPPTNEAPEIETLTPAEDSARLMHGLELYNVEWQVTDAENDQMWVTVYFNTEPVVDDNLELVPTTIHTDADGGFAVINTAEVEPGTYWVYCSVTDGGSTSGSWSAGILELVTVPEECIEFGSPDDCNDNSVLDACEIDLGFLTDCNVNGIPDGCEIDSGAASDLDENGVPDDCQLVPFFRGDANDDGSLDVSDAVTVIGVLFRGNSTFNCLEAADVNNDSEIDITDIVYSLEFLFRAGVAPPSPGPPFNEVGCGFDSDAPNSEDFIGCDEYSGC